MAPRKDPRTKAQADLDKATAALERAHRRLDKASDEVDAADLAVERLTAEVEYKASHPALQGDPIQNAQDEVVSQE